MALLDYLSGREMRTLTNAGVMGMHLVSGPAVGFAIGWGLDTWLDLSPICGITFLFIGIGAGFLNVYRDARELVAKLDSQAAAKNGGKKVSRP